MKKSKKFIANLLLLAMAGTVITGCNSTSSDTKPQSANSNDAIDTSEEVALKMILVGGKPADCDEVYDEVNKAMKEKINATLEPIFYDWGDWKTKYPLAFSSGEKFDLIYTSNWAFYDTTARSNGFYELTDDMLQKYAPNTWADVTEKQWMETLIEGKKYMVPYTNKESNSIWFAMIRGDLREKYNIPEVTDVDSLINYMEVVAEKDTTVRAFATGGLDGTLMLKRAIFEMANQYRYISISGQEIPMAIDIEQSIANKNITLVDYFEDKAYRDWLEQVKEFREKGFWSQSALSNKVINDEAFDNGASATFIRGFNVGNAYVNDNLVHPEWKLEVVRLWPDQPVYTNTVLSNGMAIHATSKYPERALMALDLLRHDKEINDLTTLGIEGTHWKAVGEDQFEPLEGCVNFGMDSACPWGWRTNLYRLNAAYPEVVKEANTDLQENGTEGGAYNRFSFNSEPVKTEVAAVAAVISTYRPVLEAGFAEDIDATLAEYKNKLEAAGYAKVVEEYKKQADEFVKQYYAN